jgi:hypothetical protein
MHDIKLKIVNLRNISPNFPPIGEDLFLVTTDARSTISQIYQRAATGVDRRIPRWSTRPNGLDACTPTNRERVPA